MHVVKRGRLRPFPSTKGFASYEVPHFVANHHHLSICWHITCFPSTPRTPVLFSSVPRRTTNPCGGDPANNKDS